MLIEDCRKLFVIGVLGVAHLWNTQRKVFSHLERKLYQINPQGAEDGR
jgi:hypothetical protein